MIERPISRPQRGFPWPPGLLGLASLALALGSGCGAGGNPESTAPPRVYHLDPRLEDGRSAADVLAERRAVVTEWIFRGTDSLGDLPWEIENAALRPVPGGGVGVIGNVPGDREAERVVLRCTEPLDAAAFDVLELDISRAGRGATRVRWSPAPGAVANPPAGGGASVAHPEVSEGIHTVRVPLASQLGWKGLVRGLRVLPNESGTQRFAVHAIRCVREGFAPGSSPLASEVRERPFGDGGLLALGREARRVWPTDTRVALVHEDLTLPEGATFESEWAVPPGIRTPDSRPHPRVEVRPVGRSAWTTAEGTVVPPNPGEGRPWGRVTADLCPWVGERVDLRLRNDPDGTAEEDLELDPERARFLWAAPRVLGRTGEEGTRPDVVIVTLDTTRADALLPAKGDGDLPRTPFFESLRDESLVFTNAWSSSNSTSPSHASILTGVALQDHGLLDNWSVLGDSNVTLAEAFRAAGYETAAAVSVEHLQAGRSGLDQGFDRFLLSDPYAWLDGRSTVDRVLEWVAQWERDGERPLFLWVHLFDPHTPYAPPASFLEEHARRTGSGPPPKRVATPTLGIHGFGGEGKFLEGVDNGDYARWLYDAGVSYADRLSGRLWKGLQARARADETLFVMTSDHGEAMGERGFWCDHTSVYPGVLRVPLLLRLPGGTRAGTHDTLAWTLDIAPTLLDAAGLPHPAGLRGRNLLELEGAGSRRLWFEHSERAQVGFLDDEHYYIRTLGEYRQRGSDHRIAAGRRFLYDRRQDPRLEHNLADEDPDRVGEFDALFEAYGASALDRTSEERMLTTEEAEHLRALGYLEAGR